MKEIPWILALGLVVWAGWKDWRSARIPNWLTMPGMLVGLLTNLLISGKAGVWMSLGGMGLALALLLPFVLLRGLGAGDWKLMGALGAFVGTKQVLLILLGTVFLTGVLAVIQITRMGRWRVTVANLWELILMFLTFGRHARPDLTLENPGLLKLPFGSVAAVATVLCYGVIRI